MYALHAIKYAELKARKRGEIFLGGDPHDAPIDMDYFVWLAIGEDRVVAIDMGFNEETGTRRGRTVLRNPVDPMPALGVDPATVGDVVVTHMHYDHAGNFDRFPNARFHIQDKEMEYVTGRQMTHAQQRFGFEIDDVIAMLRRIYGERAVFHDGHGVVAPGIEVHHVGGHTRGLQFVTVETRRGAVVLASDAAHYYESYEQKRVFHLVDNVGAMLEGFRRLQETAERPELIVPGHDPEVMRRYPPSSPDLEGVAVRLDVEPAT